MPAHVPRRTFAKPFILTVATAAAACSKSTVDQPLRNPPPPDTAPSASSAPLAETAAPNASSAPLAAKPDAPDPSAPADRTWSLDRDDKKACTVAANVECKPGRTCNPPPPMAYACPADVTRYPATIRLVKGETECKVHVMPDMSCPHGMRCNPPPPHDVTVPCPK